MDEKGKREATTKGMHINLSLDALQVQVALSIQYTWSTPTISYNDSTHVQNDDQRTRLCSVTKLFAFAT